MNEKTMNDFIVKQGRVICLDTETTGIKPELGHRVIEIGCIELIDLKPTGKTFHSYLNPKRPVEAGSFAVHGISDDFLKDKPLFETVADDFCNFIQNSTLVIHNAAFDMGFMNNELKLSSKSPIPNKVIDSVVFAKYKFPGSPASLDALCKRFSISLDERKYHGALLDARLLADVYIKLCADGGNILFQNNNGEQDSILKSKTKPKSGVIYNIPISNPSNQELEKHKAFFG